MAYCLYIMLLVSVRVCYLQDPTRKVSVIVDTAIALAPLSHEVTIETRVSRGVSRHGLAELLNVAHFAHSLIARVAVLEAPEEEGGTNKCGQPNYTNDNTGSNGSSVGPSLLIGFTV